MKSTVKHIPFLYLFTLLAGTLFFIPAIFVNRFITAPALWVQAGISIGIAGYVLLTKERIPLPPKTFIFLMMIWTIYHLWQSRGNVENRITIITLTSAFFLSYAIWSRLKDKKLLFLFFSFLALALSLWGLGQFARLFPSYNGSFAVTGPFDNPAGISASLALLLPFLLYGCLQKKYREIAIIVVCLIVTVIILSQARAAVLATVVIFLLFFIRLLRERNIKPLPVHYTAISVSCLLLLAGLFFMKKDSADGRLLIWQCSAQLISRKPVCGYGGNGFTANYMNEQASYFTKHPDSKYLMLADNVRHPFNEFLKWMVNYGLAGLFLTLILVIIPLSVSWKNNSPEQFFIRLSLLSIGICALFSYPFNYPFVRLMTVMLLAFALAANPQSITIPNGYLSKGVALLFSLGLLSATAYQTFYERAWHKIAHKSLRGETRQMLPLYKSLYMHLRYKDLFLYNYAAELNVVERYKGSLQIARECDSLWADYDLQMLMADNCLQLQQYSDSEKHLKKAAAMCPVKFMPLYQLTELYLETGRKEEARVLAQKILDKNVKVPSPVINSIKSKMRSLLNELDSLDDSPQLNHSGLKI
ncbi:O-antigen ligase family protein [uncultured Proteiniphilum sp.]|uniref:O-antigen ligase family protein n=1 Tax=uncultured Proteiniphilum sp. TaxID=497637 RepID=UPI0026315046|nr:O-antigen ligase family protein [uncultured Proteiniphilum sp.]